MGVAPSYRIVEGEGNDITSLISARLESIVLQDVSGMTADTVTITLDDDGKIEAPAKGARLTVSIGYPGELITYGVFVVSDIQYSGPPDKIAISATSTPLNTDAGYGAMKSVKSRTWRNTTLAAMVRDIATANELRGAAHPDFEGNTIGHLNQTDESDISFLTRLSRLYDATVKIGGATITFTPAKGGESTIGVFLEVNAINRSDISDYITKDMTPKKFQSVEAKYIDPDEQIEKTVREGEGDPVFRISTVWETEAEARKRAKAKLGTHARGKNSLGFSIAGNPRLIAESKINVMGVRSNIDGEYVIKSATHVINQQGYVTRVEAIR